MVSRLRNHFFVISKNIMKDFSISATLGLMSRTFPFLVFRFLIYFGITLAYLLLTGVGVGIGYLIGSIGGAREGGSLIGGLVGFGIASGGVYLIREYLLYMVKAGHIAVLVELMQGKSLPGGKGQIDYAQAMVRERFTQSSIMFGLDQLIKGVIRAFNRMFFTISSFIPLPGMNKLVKFINSVVNLSLTYLDEVILAYNFKTQATNPWKSSQTALILYAQNYKSFLKNAFFITFFIWGITLLTFLLVLIPVFFLISLFPGAAGGIALLIAIVFAWGLKQAIIEPLGMTALMQVFFKVTEGQQPNPEWDEKLSSLSTQFGKIKVKAREWQGSGPAPDPAMPPSN